MYTGNSAAIGSTARNLQSGHWGANQAIEGRNNPIPAPRYRPSDPLRDAMSDIAHLGGRSSLFNQPAATSDFSGSGRSQSRHWNVRCPLPPGGSARIKKAPQSGQVGLSDWPIAVIQPPFTYGCLFGPQLIKVKLGHCVFQTRPLRIETGQARGAYHKAMLLCRRRRRREITSLTPKPTVNPIIKLPKISSSTPNMLKA